MFAVLRQHNFALVWIGQIISLIGDWVLFAALPFYIYSLTNSALATGLMFIVQTVPRLCLGSLAGVFVDRWNRKYTMVVTDLIQFFVLLPLLLVRSADLIWIVYVFAFVENTVSQFFIPAKTAIIPQLVSEKDLLNANSLNSTSQELTRLVGPFIGSTLLVLLGVNSVVLVDACSFLLSALLISLVVLSPNPTRTEDAPTRVTPGAALLKVWREWIDGMSLVKQTRVVTAIFITMSIAMIGEGLVQVLFVPYVEQILHGNALVLGWIMSAQAVGGILGSFLVPRLSKWIKPGLLIPLSGFLFGALLAVAVLIPVLAVVLPLITVIGVVVICCFVSQITLLQSNVANEYQGRIFGALNTLQGLTMLLGMSLASGLTDTLGVIPMMLLDAGCNILSALFAFVLLRNTSISTPEADAEITHDGLLGTSSEVSGAQG